MKALSSLELRTAIRQKYAWPGGYEIFGVCDDGATLCCGCMRSEYRQIAYSRRNEIRDGWHVDAVDNASNYDSQIDCDHCGKSIVQDWQAEGQS